MSNLMMSRMVLMRLEQAHPGRLRIVSEAEAGLDDGWEPVGRFSWDDLALVKGCKRMLELGREVTVVERGMEPAEIFFRAAAGPGAPGRQAPGGRGRRPTSGRAGVEEDPSAPEAATAPESDVVRVSMPGVPSPFHSILGSLSRLPAPGANVDPRTWERMAEALGKIEILTPRPVRAYTLDRLSAAGAQVGLYAAVGSASPDGAVATLRVQLGVGESIASARLEAPVARKVAPPPPEAEPVARIARSAAQIVDPVVRRRIQRRQALGFILCLTLFIYYAQQRADRRAAELEEARIRARVSAQVAAGASQEGPEAARVVGADGWASVVEIDKIRAAYGQFDKDELRLLVSLVLPELRSCHAGAEAPSAELIGQLTVGFLVGGDGRTSKMQIRRRTMPSEAADDCVMAALEGLRFPVGAVSGSEPLVATFAFSWEQ